jgi:hypothetical protein
MRIGPIYFRNVCLNEVLPKWWCLQITHWSLKLFVLVRHTIFNYKVVRASSVTYTCNLLIHIYPLHVSALRPSSEGQLSSTCKETLYILPLVGPHLQHLILSLHIYVTDMLHMLELVRVKSLTKSLWCVSWDHHDCHLTILTYHQRLLSW